MLLELREADGKPNARAFLLSEEMRDRLAMRAAVAYQPLQQADLDAFLGDLPSEAAVIEYGRLAGATPTTPVMVIAWILSNGTLEEVTLMPGTSIDQKVAALRQAAERQDHDAWRSTAEDLYSIALAPLLSRLPPETKRLLIIPDGILAALPFAGLVNPASGQYLDEEISVTLAPSVSFLFNHFMPTASARRTVDEVLSIGISDFGNLGLRRLNSAPEEAATVAKVYGGPWAESWQGRNWEGLRTRLSGAKVVHLATHAQQAPWWTGWSWLALENETVNLKRLWDELPSLPNTRLVVLSTCESVTLSAETAGFGGLARPFLAKGVKTVVGTLWPLDDKVAATFFPAFHRAYRDTGDAATALRAARAEMPDWEKRPWDWAGVQAIEANQFER